jgi:hypothetical protein
MPIEHFNAASGAPILQKGQLAASSVAQRFEETGVFLRQAIPGIGDCYTLPEELLGTPFRVADLRARLFVESILLLAVRDWMRKLGLASYDKVAVRQPGEEAPRVGTFAWDLTAPSYLAPFVAVTTNGSGKIRPGFVACDVLLGSEISEEGLAPFLHKCSTLRMLRRVAPCLQLFIARNFSHKAFGAARGAGVIAATPETLFGSEVAAGLDQLTQLLSQTLAAAVNPEAFERLFKSLAKIEGAALNLRGALFEYVVAELVRLSGTPKVVLNRLVTHPKTHVSAEIDVLDIRDNQYARFIECKGHQPGGRVRDADVDRWLDDRIAVIRGYALAHPDWTSIRHRFEFWTSGKFSAVARGRLEKARSTIKKYDIDFKDGNEVRAIAHKLSNKAILRTLDEHFLEHPLASN